MPDGPSAKKQEPTGDCSSKRSKSATVSPRREVPGELSQGLAKTVKQLQSDVDKLKYAEHKRRELSRAIKERKAAEEELQAWIGGKPPSRGGTPVNARRLEQISEDIF